MIESSSVRRALSRVREEISPTRDDKARLRARILAPALLGPESAGSDAGMQGQAGAPALTARAARVGSLTPWAALKAAGTAGAAVGLALLGVGGGVGFWLGHEAASARAPSAAVVKVPARAEAPLPERAAVAPSAGAKEPAQNDAIADVAPTPAAPSEARREVGSQRTHAPPRAHAARPRAAPSPLDAELALLRRVERALRNNDATLARALLGELDERFPDSRLREERAAARRIADCRSGEPGAGENARAFLREHDTSVYRKRIAVACALDGEPHVKSREPDPMTNAENADTHVR